MPSIVIPVVGGIDSSTHNVGNFVAQIQGAAANAQAVPGDPLGVRTLGRNTGLALQQINAAINSFNPGTITISSTDITNLIDDSGVTHNGVQVVS